MYNIYFVAEHNIISQRRMVPISRGGMVHLPAITNGGIPTNLDKLGYIEGDERNGYKLAGQIPVGRILGFRNYAAEDPNDSIFYGVFLKGNIDYYYVAMLAPFKKDLDGSWRYRLFSYNDVTWLFILDYFARELELYGFTRNRIMMHIVKMHSMLQRQLDSNGHSNYEFTSEIATAIDEMCWEYLDVSEEVYQIMTQTYHFIYLGMVAEEFKDMENGKYITTSEPTKLGSLVKVDGALLCLMFNLSPADAASYMNGKNHEEVLKRTARFGIYRNDWCRGTSYSPKGFGSSPFNLGAYELAQRALIFKSPDVLLDEIEGTVVEVSNKHEDI